MKARQSHKSRGKMKKAPVRFNASKMPAPMDRVSRSSKQFASGLMGKYGWDQRNYLGMFSLIFKEKGWLSDKEFAKFGASSDPAWVLQLELQLQSLQHPESAPLITKESTIQHLQQMILQSGHERRPIQSASRSAAPVEHAQAALASPPPVEDEPKTKKRGRPSKRDLAERRARFEQETQAALKKVHVVNHHHMTMKQPVVNVVNHHRTSITQRAIGQLAASIGMLRHSIIGSREQASDQSKDNRLLGTDRRLQSPFQVWLRQAVREANGPASLQMGEREIQRKTVMNQVNVAQHVEAVRRASQWMAEFQNGSLSANEQQSVLGAPGVKVSRQGQPTILHAAKQLLQHITKPRLKQASVSLDATTSPEMDMSVRRQPAEVNASQGDWKLGEGPFSNREVPSAVQFIQSLLIKHTEGQTASIQQPASDRESHASSVLTPPASSPSASMAQGYLATGNQLLPINAVSLTSRVPRFMQAASSVMTHRQQVNGSAESQGERGIESPLESETVQAAAVWVRPGSQADEQAVEQQSSHHQASHQANLQASQEGSLPDPRSMMEREDQANRPGQLEQQPVKRKRGRPRKHPVVEPVHQERIATAAKANEPAPFAEQLSEGTGSRMSPTEESPSIARRAAAQVKREDLLATYPNRIFRKMTEHHLGDSLSSARKIQSNENAMQQLVTWQRQSSSNDSSIRSIDNSTPQAETALYETRETVVKKETIRGDLASSVLAKASERLGDSVKTSSISAGSQAVEKDGIALHVAPNRLPASELAVAVAAKNRQMTGERTLVSGIRPASGLETRSGGSLLFRKQGQSPFPQPGMVDNVQRQLRQADVATPVDQRTGIAVSPSAAERLEATAQLHTAGLQADELAARVMQRSERMAQQPPKALAERQAVAEARNPEQVKNGLAPGATSQANRTEIHEASRAPISSASYRQSLELVRRNGELTNVERVRMQRTAIQRRIEASQGGLSDFAAKQDPGISSRRDSITHPELREGLLASREAGPDGSSPLLRSRPQLTLRAGRVGQGGFVRRSTVDIQPLKESEQAHAAAERIHEQDTAPVSMVQARRSTPASDAVSAELLEQVQEVLRSAEADNRTVAERTSDAGSAHQAEGNATEATDRLGDAEADSVVSARASESITHARLQQEQVESLEAMERSPGRLEFANSKPLEDGENRSAGLQSQLDESTHHVAQGTLVPSQRAEQMSMMHRMHVQASESALRSSARSLSSLSEELAVRLQRIGPLAQHGAEQGGAQRSQGMWREAQAEHLQRRGSAADRERAPLRGASGSESRWQASRLTPAEPRSMSAAAQQRSEFGAAAAVQAAGAHRLPALGPGRLTQAAAIGRAAGRLAGALSAASEGMQPLPPQVQRQAGPGTERSGAAASTGSFASRAGLIPRRVDSAGMEPTAAAVPLSSASPASVLASRAGLISRRVGSAGMEPTAAKVPLSSASTGALTSTAMTSRRPGSAVTEPSTPLITASTSSVLTSSAAITQRRLTSTGTETITSNVPLITAQKSIPPQSSASASRRMSASGPALLQSSTSGALTSSAASTPRRLASTGTEPITSNAPMITAQSPSLPSSAAASQSMTASGAATASPLLTSAPADMQLQTQRTAITPASASAPMHTVPVEQIQLSPNVGMGQPPNAAELPASLAAILEHKQSPIRSLAEAPLDLDWLSTRRAEPENPLEPQAPQAPPELTEQQVQELIKQLPPIDISKIADRVFREIEKKMRFERQRRGY